MARPVKIDEKRKELLDKAINCFTKYGYSKTTLDDIAKETGINKASLYHYFKNKEELFLQVLLLVAEQGIQELETRTEKIKTPEKRVVFYFSERLHFYLQVVKLNSLNKETLLQLQFLFDAAYQPVKEKEINYITVLLKQAASVLNKKQASVYARLLFDIADAIKHNAVFTGDLLENKNETTTAVKKQITDAVTLLLKGILNK